MRVTALLRDPAGFERTYSYEVKPEYANTQVFMWKDGNYACDCNRRAFLYDDADLLLEDAPCGREIRCVSLRIDGAEAYTEPA